MRNLPTRIFILLLTIFCLNSPVFAQSEDNPVSWAFEYKSISDGTNEYELRFIATTFPGWYIYSQDLESSPLIPTNFTFEKNVADDFVMMGEIEEEGDLISKYDELFEQKIKKYTDRVTFKAKVLIADTKTVQIKGRLEYMTCDASTCNPPTEVEFIFEIEPNQNFPIVTTTAPTNDYQTINSPSYSVMGVRNNNGMVINVHEGPIDIRQSNSNIYKETKVDIALTGSENIVNEDKEQVIDEKEGDLLVAANISSYLKKKKKAKKKPTLANRTITKKKEKETPAKVVTVSNPVKWNFELEKGENKIYYLVFEADVEDKWKMSEDIHNLSFDNHQNIVLVEKENSPLEITDGKVIFKKAVKFKNNTMLTGKINYSITNPEGKKMNRDTSFAFNRSGDVVVYQNNAGLWIGSNISLFCLILLTLGWKMRKTLFQ